MKVVPFVVGTLACLTICGGTQKSGPEGLFKKEACFCQLKGNIDDCLCSIDTVDYFNNKKIYPRLQSLLQKNYFKYFQYNTKKKCPFWDTSKDKCSSLSCGVKSCPHADLPPGIKDPNGKACEDDLVDETLSDSAKQDLQSWQRHDDSTKDFCDIQTETCVECDFIDLTINPERFTGYDGEPSRRIWRAIYEENCFKPLGHTGPIFLESSIENMCLEKRAFYRAVSGLHTSITIHLTSMYAVSKMGGDTLAKMFPFGGNSLDPKNLPFTSSTATETYGPNLDEFLKRFNPELTNGQGPYWLKNLYFVYLLELRALTKASNFLEKHSFYTGDIEEDIDTLIAIKELFNLFRSFPDHFDESSMFIGGQQLKTEFRDHFRNITTIMDCVGCEKCKLWGKLQTTGLGTALKILFTDHDTDLVLTRNEIVALFNAFGRISTSIFQLERFRDLTKKQYGRDEL